MKKAILVIVFLTVTMSVLFGIGIWRFTLELDGLDSMQTNEMPNKRTNILVMGCDYVEDGSTRTDAIMLVSMDHSTANIYAFSLLRDTRVEIPGYGLEKFGHAYMYGGAELTRQTVEGFLDIPVHYHVVFDYSGFEAIVDALGGVTIDVKEKMVYQDISDGLYIDIDPGVQRFSGEEALKYIRFRSDGHGDVGRVARQLDFVKALGNQILVRDSIWKIPRIIFAGLRSLETDMNIFEMISLASFVRRFDPERIVTTSLPGTPRLIDEVDYWIADSEITQVLTNKMVKGTSWRDEPRVQVLNGNGDLQSAFDIAALLEEKGYHITTVGYAWHMDFEATMVIDKIGTPKVAAEIGNTINGVVERNLQLDVSTSDIVVITGKDILH